MKLLAGVQVLPAEPTKLLEGLFIFSLIWSIGATTETAGRTLFNRFLRKLLRKAVEESPDRMEFDLGPGVTITPPEFDLRPMLPVVSMHPAKPAYLLLNHLNNL